MVRFEYHDENRSNMTTELDDDGRDIWNERSRVGRILLDRWSNADTTSRNHRSIKQISSNRSKTTDSTAQFNCPL